MIEERIGRGRVEERVGMRLCEVVNRPGPVERVRRFLPTVVTYQLTYGGAAFEYGGAELQYRK